MFRRVLLALALVAGAQGAHAADMCSRSGGYHLSHDADWPMFISVRAGATCEATFGSRGAAIFVYKRLLLVTPPARGKIKLREGGYYIYTAPAAAGTDKFTLRVCGSENNSPGCATLNYTVTVH